MKEELQVAKDSRTMKISIKCDNLETAKKLIDKEADLLYFGIENFSCRFNNYINLETLKKIVEIKKDILSDLLHLAYKLLLVCDIVQYFFLVENQI